MQSEQQSTEQIGKKIRKKLRLLNYKKEQNKQFLVSSYRKLDVLSKKQNSFYLANHNYIDLVTNYAFKVKPFNVDNINFKQNLMFSSSICRQNYTGNRKCSIPRVIIDNQQINEEVFSFKPQLIIFRQKEFGVTIEGEDNCQIIYTIDGKHPLISTQAVFSSATVVTTLRPPCILNIVATKRPIKIQSSMLTLHVKLNKSKINKNQSNLRSGILRPAQSFPFDESNSLATDSYINIQGQNPSS